MGSQQYGAIIEQVLSTASSGGTLTLTNVSPQNHRITGVLAHSVVLPDATTFSRAGRVFSINNQSTGTVTVKYNDTTTLTTIAPGSSKRFDLFSNASSNGDWGVSGGAGSSSGSGTGAKNYNPNPNANTDTSGFAAFNTTFSGGLPTTITAGSTKLALNRQTTNPLEGTASFEMDVTTAAASTGHGIISDAMTIDDEDLAKILQFSMSYSFSANPSNVDASGTSTQTVELWVYNVGLASWYQPTGFRGINTKGVPGYVAAQIQSDSSDATNKNQYQIALIIRNDPSGTFKMLFDSVVFGPQKIVFGAPAKDLAQYSVTLAGSTTVSGFFEWGRSGQFVRVKGRMALTGAAQAVDISFTAPPGASPDLTNRLKGGGDNVGEYPVSSGKAQYGSIANATQIDGNIQWDANNSRFYMRTADRWRTSGTSVPVVTWNSGDTVDVDFTYEVAGWSSNVQMSSDTDTRVVSAGYTTNTAQSIPSGDATVTIKFEDKEYDDHAMYDTTTGIGTIKVSGRYRISAGLKLANGAVTWNSGESFVINIYKNSVQHRLLASFENFATHTRAIGLSGSTEIDFIAGDTFEIRAYQDSTETDSLNGVTTNNWFEISRLSGPSVIAMSEQVRLRYYTTAAQSVAGSPTITYGTKVTDSHGAFSGTTFTAPRSDFYLFSARCAATLNLSTAQQLDIVAVFAGTDIEKDIKPGTGASSLHSVNVSSGIYMNAGQTLTFRVDSSIVGNLTGNAEENTLAIWTR